MQQIRSFRPISWVHIGLAVLPGVIVVLSRSGLAEQILSGSAVEFVHLYGLPIACVILLLLGLGWQRRIAPWLFPGVGVLLLMLPGLVLGLLLPPTRDNSALYDGLVNLWVVSTWVVSIVVMWVCRRDVIVSKPGWLLLGLLGLALVVSPTTLLFMGGLLALPIAVGVLFARRFGLRAGLISLGGVYWLVDSVFDPSYFLPSTYATLIEVSLAFFFLVIPPIWVLRSRSLQAMKWGLLLPPGLVLVSSELIRGIVYPGTAARYSLIRGLGVAQFILALALAAVLYQAVRGDNESRPAAGATGAA